MEEFIKDIGWGARSFFESLRDDLGEIFRTKRKQEGKSTIEKKVGIWDYLPYDRYDMARGIFYNKESTGFILKVRHFSGIGEREEEKLESFFNYEAPSECYIEVINYASPKIGYITDNWEKQAKGNPLYEKLSKKRVDYINSGNWRNILGSRGAYIFRDYELYFAVSVKKGTELEVLTSFKEKMQYSLENLGSKVTLVNDVGLAIFLREFLYPNTSPHIERIEERKDRIIEYMMSDSAITAEKDSLNIKSNNEESTEKFKYLIFEIVEYPDKWSMEKSGNLMEHFEHGVRMPFPFLIRYGVKFLDHDSSKRKASRIRATKIVQNDAGRVATFVPKMIEEGVEWDYVAGCLDKGQRLAKGVMNVIAVIKEGEDEVYAAQAVKTHFSGLNFKIEQIKYEVLNGFIASMPFGFSHYFGSLEQLKITGTVTSEVAKNLMPVFADHGNTASPLMLLGGRRGQLFYYDNFTSKENFNMVVIGKPGSGKSTFLNELTVCTLRIGGQVVTLDDGASSKNSCLVQEGTHIDFETGELCINPFTFFIDKGSMKDYTQDFEEPFIELVTSVLCIIVGIDRNLISPENTIYQTIMRNAIVAVMDKYGRDGGFKEIGIELKENELCRPQTDEEIADRISYAIEGYTTGKSAHYFNGSSTLRIDNMLTVFEFHKINSNKVLKNATLMLVTFLVYSKMFKRERRMALIIDEAWLLLQHDGMSGFMREIARKARKYRGCLVIATQNYSDFNPEFSKTAHEILPNCDWRILLGADNSVDKELKTLFSLNHTQINLLKTVKAEKGLYSEYMICHKEGGSDIGRLFLEPFSQGLYTSTAEDVKALEDYKAAGMSVEEAVEMLVSRGRKYVI